MDYLEEEESWSEQENLWEESSDFRREFPDHPGIVEAVLEAEKERIGYED